jgi:hypothetical protein
MAETFILREIRRKITINKDTFSCNLLVIIVRFSLKLNFANIFLENSQAFILKNSSIVEERTDSHTNKKKAIVAFRKFAKAPTVNQNQIDVHNSIILNTLYYQHIVCGFSESKVPYFIATKPLDVIKCFLIQLLLTFLLYFSI